MSLFWVVSASQSLCLRLIVQAVLMPDWLLPEWGGSWKKECCFLPESCFIGYKNNSRKYRATFMEVLAISLVNLPLPTVSSQRDKIIVFSEKLRHFHSGLYKWDIMTCHILEIRSDELTIPCGLRFYESFTIHFECCLIGPVNHMPLLPFPAFYDCDLYKEEFLNNLMERGKSEKAI